MLSFKANQAFESSMIPLEPMDLAGHKLLIATMNHSEDVSDLSDVFTENQKKLLKDPKVERVLKASDDETIVTFFDALPEKSDDFICSNDQHFGTKHFIIVSDLWFRENGERCFVCNGERKTIDNSGLQRELNSNSESISDSSKEEEEELLDDDDEDFDFPPTDDEEEEEWNNRRPLSRSSVLSAGSGRIPGTIEVVFDIEDIYRMNRLRQKLLKLEPPILRQRAITQGAEAIEQEIEIVPTENLQKIDDDLRSQSLFFEAIYRYQKPEECLQEFGYVNRSLRRSVTQAVYEATKELDNFEPGVYIVELWIQVYKMPHKHKFNVPIKIFGDEKTMQLVEKDPVWQPEQEQETEQEEVQEAK